MVFSSMIFLWAFLPIIICIYYIAKPKYRNVLLLVASLLFYAWGEPVYIFLMLFSIGINWVLGLLINQSNNQKRIILIVAVIFNLWLLGYYKYSGFIVDIVNSVLDTNIEKKVLTLPIGISFFTFQILSYQIDLYRGKYSAQKSIINLALYISFFPQLIAGPIVRYVDIEAQIKNREVSIDKFAEGVRRFIYGLGKKVIIANTLAIPVDTIYSLDNSNLTSGLVWIASIMYTLQIYFDFSGYSDMAIGLGKMFGFDFLENFSYPYMATSVQDFWRKWHISLSSWFREYLYIPLGGNRHGKARTYINLFIVFFVTGLWHGAGFTFIVWGLYHGFFSIIERLGLKKLLDKNKLIGLIYSFIVVNFGWVLFRADSIKQAASFIKIMIMPWKYYNNVVVWQDYIPYVAIFMMSIGIIGSGAIQKIMSLAKIDSKLRNSYIEIVYCGLIFIISISMLASNTYNPFIYYRF